MIKSHPLRADRAHPPDRRPPQENGSVSSALVETAVLGLYGYVEDPGATKNLAAGRPETVTEFLVAATCRAAPLLVCRLTA